MESFLLTGKNILVTGASSGIGRETAVRVAMAGASVVLTGRDPGRLEETYRMLQGTGHTLLPFDLLMSAEIDELASQVSPLAGMVHSAGVTTHMPAKMIREKDIARTFDINFKAAVLLVSTLLKKKKIDDGASLVFLSSIATHFPYFGGSMYTASKAALEAYCRVLALELAPRRIRANCLSPSFVETPMVDGASEVISSESMDQFRKSAPLGFGHPRDVANPAVFFLSDASRWITGTSLVLGGIV